MPPVPPPFATMDQPRVPRPPHADPAPAAPLAGPAHGGHTGSQGRLPGVRWGWREAVLGLVVGFAPTVALSLAAGTGTGDGLSGDITTLTAVGLLISSGVMYGWQVLAAWFFSLRRAGQGLVAWGFRRPTAAFFWVIPLALVAVYAVTYAHDILVNPEQQALLEHFPKTSTGVALLAVLAVVMAPLFEELFFRGFLFRGLARSWGWPLAAVLSAAVFGAVHQQVTVFIPLFALGFVLAWVYERTGSIWTPIALHAVFNGISVFAWALT